jgi:hypothetical protein
VDVEVELISGSLWTFRADKIVRVHFYANREELREAVGLESHPQRPPTEEAR